MRTYEVMFIVNPTVAEDERETLIETLKKTVVEKGGTVTRVEDMGRRRLAYPIEKFTEGYYVLFEIEGAGTEIAELERRMRVVDQIVRYLTVRVDLERRAAEKRRLRRAQKFAKRSGSSGFAAEAPVDSKPVAAE